MSQLTDSLDQILQRTVSEPPGVPGVVAVVTDGDGNLYEGAAGERSLGSGSPMTPDTVCAIFSTTASGSSTASR